MLKVVKGPVFLLADSEDCSDWANAQADPSLRWVHRSFCSFCHAAARMSFLKCIKIGVEYMNVVFRSQLQLEPPHDKTNRMACAPREDSNQPGHLPSLNRVFAVRWKKAWVLSYPLSAQRRLIRLGGCPV